MILVLGIYIYIVNANVIKLHTCVCIMYTNMWFSNKLFWQIYLISLLVLVYTCIISEQNDIGINSKQFVFVQIKSD